MKTFPSLMIALLLPGVAHAITVLPSVSVEDKSHCVSSQSMKDELSAVLPAGRDHHAYAVGVLVQSAKDADSAQVTLTVEDSASSNTSLERTLTIKRGECGDAARLLARIAAKAMEGAPSQESGGLGVKGAHQASPSVSSDRMPDEWIHFKRNVVVTVTSNRYGSTANVNEFETPVQGPYEKELEWEDFYTKVGRSDLAATFHAHNLRRNVLYWGGIGVAVMSGLVGALVATVAGGVGLGAMLYGIKGVNASNGGASISSPVSPLFLGMMALIGLPLAAIGVSVIPMLAGVAMTWVGVLLPLQPAELHEVKAMADEHNRGLLGETRSDGEQKPAGTHT